MAIPSKIRKETASQSATIRKMETGFFIFSAEVTRWSRLILQRHPQFLLTLLLAQLGEIDTFNSMKTTMELPDELYRRLRERSASEGLPFRSVAKQLFENWLEQAPAKPCTKSGMRNSDAPWLAVTHPFVKYVVNHDLQPIQKAIAAKWGEAAQAKAKPKRGRE